MSDKIFLWDESVINHLTSESFLNAIKTRKRIVINDLVFNFKSDYPRYLERVNVEHKSVEINLYFSITTVPKLDNESGVIILPLNGIWFLEY